MMIVSGLAASMALYIVFHVYPGISPYWAVLIAGTLVFGGLPGSCALNRLGILKNVSGKELVRHAVFGGVLMIAMATGITMGRLDAPIWSLVLVVAVFAALVHSFERAKRPFDFSWMV